MIPQEKASALCAGLDDPRMEERLQALELLVRLERAGELPEGPSELFAPGLPSYEHVHSGYSYGTAVPGVHSVTRMVWAAHANGAESMALVEHESVKHLVEAQAAIAVLRRLEVRPPVLVLGVEFKTRIDPQALPGPGGEAFRRLMKATWGQCDAAWVVGYGASLSPALVGLVAQYQKLKRERARRQLELLRDLLPMRRELPLEEILTPEGNLTDRQFCSAVAARVWPDARPAELFHKTWEVRHLLDTGAPAYVPMTEEFLPYPELLRRLQAAGLVNFSTSQLKGGDLREMMPHFLEWGIRGLDTGGIEPDESDSRGKVQTVLDLARQHGLLVIGGSDYRGTGTGWKTFEPWMRDPLVAETVERLAMCSQK